MPIQNKPDEKIFASNAKPREVDNFPDINRGWGFTFEQTGGIPTMEHFNALFKRNDEHLMYLLQRGVPEWSSTIDYPQGACVQYQGKTYRSLTQNRNQTPATGSQHWTLWGLTIADIPEVRPASLTAAGITQLDNAINSNAEDRAATPKAVKQVNDKVEINTRSLNERIPNSKKSDVVNSNSSDTVATSRAVKTAYDLANSKQSPATTLAGYGITDFQLRTATGNLNDFRTAGIYSINSIHNSYNRPKEGARQSQGFTGNLQVITGGAGNESWCHQIFRRHYSGETYERWQTASNNNSWSAWKRTDNQDGLPIGSVVAFPKEINNPQGFLRCDGTTFAQNTYPDLYRVLGNKNRLPNLTRSDVGMLAYFPTDTIPEGWIAFDSIRSVVNATSYPKLYRYLIAKYQYISNVPLAEDRFIRSQHGSLRVGDKQDSSTIEHYHGITNYNNNAGTFTSSRSHVAARVPNNTRGNTGWNGHDGGRLGADDNAENRTFNYNVFTSLPINDSSNTSETRPKSIIFKLCIKAKNSFDDVQFWIKAFGEVTNAGTLDAGRLAQNLQDKADRAHTHTVSQITDFNPEVVKLINQHNGFTQNISTNGWTVLPNGLMIQWGVATTNDILFPRAFPRECFIVSHSKTGGGRDTRVSNVSRTGFTSSATITVGTTYYVAIGH
ncbi:phage tail protein [[Haemophilus] felis]|nr:phage tail protein [[Haemophilus] felis]